VGLGQGLERLDLGLGLAVERGKLFRLAGKIIPDSRRCVGEGTPCRLYN
jgi:hypothetical protein